jgi:hypothetical protein
MLMKPTLAKNYRASSDTTNFYWHGATHSREVNGRKLAFSMPLAEKVLSGKVHYDDINNLFSWADARGVARELGIEECRWERYNNVNAIIPPQGIKFLEWLTAKTPDDPEVDNDF